VSRTSPTCRNIVRTYIVDQPFLGRNSEVVKVMGLLLCLDSRRGEILKLESSEEISKNVVSWSQSDWKCDGYASSE